MSSVKFRGWLPFSEVRQAMSEATVLVHPSDGLGDGLPNVVREAMAVGTPVVASDVAGIPDALDKGCGVLVPPKNVAALADAIGGLLQDPAERQRIAERARHRAEERYNLWRNGATLAGLLRATRRGGAPKPAVALTPVSSGGGARQQSYDLVALHLLLAAPGNTPDLADLDWADLRVAARRGGALVRVADALSGRDPLPPRFSAAAAQACTNAQRVLELTAQLSDACNRLGIAHAFLRTLECYPDAPATIELLVEAPTAGIDKLILGDLPVTRRHPALHHRLSNVITYTAAYGNRVAIRHGRIGRLGEHARYARLLLARARPLTVGTMTGLAPSRSDHLLLLAMHQLYTRPAFRLSDVHGAIDAIRQSQIDWDYLFATAFSAGIVPAVGSYLQYLDGIHRSLGHRSLVSGEALARFGTTDGEQSASFPRISSAARLYLRHVRATVESGRWHSAARLSLLPVMAALTGARRSA